MKVPQSEILKNKIFNNTSSDIQLFFAFFQDAQKQ